MPATHRGCRVPTFDWSDLLAAFALYLVLEGLLPALAPARFRDALRGLVGMDDRVLRVVGISSMVAGALLLTYARS